MAWTPDPPERLPNMPCKIIPIITGIDMARTEDNPLALQVPELIAWRRFRLRMFMGAFDTWEALGRKADPCCVFYREFRKMFEHENVMLGAYMSDEEFAHRHPSGAFALFTIEKLSTADTLDRDGLRRL